MVNDSNSNQQANRWANEWGAYHQTTITGVSHAKKEQTKDIFTYQDYNEFGIESHNSAW